MTLFAPTVSTSTSMQNKHTGGTKNTQPHYIKTIEGDKEGKSKKREFNDNIVTLNAVIADGNRT